MYAITYLGTMLGCKGIRGEQRVEAVVEGGVLQTVASDQSEDPIESKHACQTTCKQKTWEMRGTMGVTGLQKVGAWPQDAVALQHGVERCL